MAEATLALFQQPERWIHQRIERIRIDDNRVARHQLTVEFTLPAGIPPVSDFAGIGLFIAPLFLLVKDAPRPLRSGRLGRRRFTLSRRTPRDSQSHVIPTAPFSNLDFTHQSGRSLALMTRRQSSRLANAILLRAAERVLGEPATVELKRRISAIAHGGWLESQPVLTWMFEERSVHGSDPRLMLRSDDAFLELAYALASHSLIACLLTDQVAPHSAYQLSYDEALVEETTTSKALPGRVLPRRPRQYSLSLSEIGASASYRLEIELAKHLRVDVATLVGKRHRHYGALLSDRDRDYSIQLSRTADGARIDIPQPLLGHHVGFTQVTLRGF
jgi:hypothetical protein